MEKESFTANYIVTFDTFLLQPIRVKDAVATHVIERSAEFTVPRKPIHIVRKSCLYYGGSLQNSTNTARLTLRNRHKLPIVLTHGFGRPYIFLPTLSPSSEQNLWIAYHAIDNYEADGLGSVVHFENGRTVSLNISALTLQRQHSFAAILEKDFLKKQQLLLNVQPTRPFTHQ